MYTSCSKSNIQRCSAQHPEQAIIIIIILFYFILLHHKWWPTFPCNSQTNRDIYLSDTHVQLRWRKMRDQYLHILVHLSVHLIIMPDVFFQNVSPVIPRSGNHNAQGPGWMGDGQDITCSPQKYCSRLHFRTYMPCPSSGPWPHSKSEHILLVHYIQYLRKLRCTAGCKHWTRSFFSVESEQVVYSQNKCLGHFDDYVEKQMVCPFFRLLFHIYTSVINASVTHLLMGHTSHLHYLCKWIRHIGKNQL
jgi:hypothetical protein